MNGQEEQVYNALKIAAERMGFNGHQAAWEKAAPKQRRDCKAGKRAVYTPTPEHCAVVDMMSVVASGKGDLDEAMNLLHQYDVAKQRLGD